MASFGVDFDVQQFKEAYNTAEDIDAYNRVQAVERALGRVQNYVGELAEAGLKLAALQRPTDSHASPAQQAFEAMPDAEIIGCGLSRRLVQAQNARTTNRTQLRPNACRRRPSRGDPGARRSA